MDHMYTKFHENMVTNGVITLLLSDIGKSFLSHAFFAPQICLLILFAKIKVSQKFPNLQYITGVHLGIGAETLHSPS